MADEVDGEHVPLPGEDHEDQIAERELDEEEAAMSKEEIAQELADLKDEAEMSVEELRAKYYGGGAAASGSNGSSETRKRPKEEETSNPSKKQKTELQGYAMNVNGAVDKKHRGLPLSEIIKLPPSAILGLADRADPMFRGLHIATIAQLGSWKFYKAAKSIKILAELEEEGGRVAESKLNVNGMLDSSYEKKSLKEILKSPVSCLQGLADWTDNVLKTHKISTVEDLANW
eukprot:CAMPEP_0167746654 /NCGR_PEP_ID=MMETSP0110_2-20121227/3833_1 /TAXON_ID=629695 /ORGANISM="Gymnochlora sp., Strain CCMP2014" /LENGTH=230 /DNA_ID=CAMNT_0007631443 /DNA_START=2068 /DNA_END=2757 /DNA_ORIENTATION=-